MKTARLVAIVIAIILQAGWGIAQVGDAAAGGVGNPRTIEFRPAIPSLPGTGTISGICFNDTNGNGLLDSAEPPLPGLSILVIADVPPPLLGVIGGRAVSRADGSFDVYDVPFGKWIVSESLPEGYMPTGDNKFPGARVVLDATHPTVSGLFFGNAITGIIAGKSFRDLDGSRSLDAGEPGLAGITIQLRSASGALVASAQTDSSGNFLFQNVLAGAYEVAQVLPSGLAQTVPGGDGTINVNLKGPPGVAGLLFGSQQATGTISGEVFTDRNSDGKRDPGEPGLGGIVIHLLDPYGLVHWTATDASGSFSFTSLPAGDFVLHPTAPSGSVVTALPGPTTLEDDGSMTGLLVGLYRPFSPDFAASVSGSVFLDRDGNGAIDGLDRPLSGVSIVLTNSFGFRATTVSSADGTFRFESLTAGDYVLSETMSPGFTQTLPKPPALSHSFTLSSGEQKDFIFLNH